MWIHNVLFISVIILQARVDFMAEASLFSSSLSMTYLQTLKKETESQVQANAKLANKIDNEFEALLERPSRRRRPGFHSPASEISKLRNEIMADKDDSTLQINDAARSDVSRLMNELMNAVSQNSYSAKIKRGEAPALRKRTTPYLTHHEILSGEDNPLEEVSVNVLDSSFDEAASRPQRQFRHSRINEKMAAHREVLEIVSVNDNDNFEFGEQIVAWKNLPKKIDGKHILIGITKTELVLIVEIGGAYKLTTTLDLNSTILSFEVFPKFNAITKSVSGIVVVAIKDVLIWFSVDTDKLTEIWRWPVQKDIILIKYYDFNKTDSLLVISEPDYPNGPTSADIYEFDFHTQQFWIVQLIPLKVPSSDISILDTGFDFLICFPQDNQTDVYKYEMATHERGRFVLQVSIKSFNVTNVAGFRIGGFSYLAIGGYNPQILRFYRGRLRPQTILSQTFGMVEYWLPIPARTYRDDLILLVQHRLDFESHAVSVLEALIWNGEAFETSLSVPCHIREELVNYGITCMIDFRRDKGIEGTTIIQRGKNISLLIPRHQAPSGLFDIKFQLISTADPIREEIEHLRRVYETFETIIEEQDAIVLEAIDATVNGLKVDGDNVVTGNWNIESLSATTVEQTANSKWTDNLVNFGGQPWTLRETEINVPTIVETLVEDEKKLKDLEVKAENLILKNMTNVDVPNTLRVKGRVNVQGQLTADELQVQSFGTESVATVLESIRKARDLKIPGSLTIKSLDVHKLYAESVNNISTSDLMTSTSNTLTFNNTLIFTKPVRVDEVLLQHKGRVNGIDLSEDLIVVGIPSNNTVPLEFDHIQISEDVSAAKHVNGFDLNITRIKDITENVLDLTSVVTRSLEVKQNLDVTKINGVVWSDLVKAMVIRKLPNMLENLEVTGKVIFENPIMVESLNGLTFPEEYLLMNGPRDSKVTGRKNFTKLLRTSEIDCEGTIDGIDPFQIVTLSTNQRIPGETRFEQIQVSESLEVNGTIKGQHLDEFLTNPNLLMTKVVESACTFKELHVLGPVFVQNSINDLDLDIVLSDVVYKTDASAEINSLKSFGNATFDAGIITESKTVNDYALKDFLTLNTDQEVRLDHLVGNVLFKNLELSGLFDGVNTTDLDLTAIKLLGEQFTEAELIVDEVTANQLLIQKTLGGYEAKDLVSLTDEVHLTGEVHFDTMFADHLHHTGDILGYGLVNEVNLTHFDLYRLSATRPQHIPKHVSVETCEVTEKFHSQQINGVDVKDFQENALQTENSFNLIYTGRIPIESLHINGSVKVVTLNDQNLEQLMSSVVWLNRPNTIRGTSKFLDTVKIEKSLNLTGFLNKQPFETFLRNLVLRNQDAPVIAGIKTFTKPVHVKKSLNATCVNDVLIKNIVLKTDKQLLNDLYVYGHLLVDNVTVQNNLNEISSDTLNDAYAYDADNKVHMLKSNTVFDTFLKIGNLKIGGALNEIEDVVQFFGNVAKKTEALNFTSQKRFTGDVTFLNGVHIDHLNGVEIGTIADDLVFKDTKEEVLVTGDVIFKSPVSVKKLQVGEDVFADNLMGCNPEEWMLNGALINEPTPIILPPVIFPAQTFSAAEMNVGFLNNKPLAELVTLHTDQYLNSTFVVDEMTAMHIHTSGTINDYNLKDEVENTLMISGDQHITLMTSFQSIRVLNSLHIAGTVNDHKFTKPVELHSNVHLESPVSFKHLKAQQLDTKDLISSIDFEHWYETALWKSGKDFQKIYGNWSVHHLSANSEISGWPYVNSFGMDHVMENVEKSREILNVTLQKHRQQYSSLCRSIDALAVKAQQNVHFLKYFEFAFAVPQLDKIVSVFSFADNGDQYLIINVGCTSGVYVWVASKGKFKHIFQEDTGHVNDWIQLTDKTGHTYLVSQAIDEHLECLVYGTNVWRFEEASLKLHRHLGNSSELFGLQNNLDDRHTFFVLHRANRIHEYDVHGLQHREWPLTTNNIAEFRFVPAEVQSGLALTNGKKFIIISKEDSAKRKKRSTTEATPSFWKRVMAKMVNGIASVETITLSNDVDVEVNDVTTRALLLRPESYVGQPKDVEKFLKTQTLKPHMTPTAANDQGVGEKQALKAISLSLADEKVVETDKRVRSEYREESLGDEPDYLDGPEPLHIDLLESFVISTERVTNSIPNVMTTSETSTTNSSATMSTTRFVISTEGVTNSTPDITTASETSTTNSTTTTSTTVTETTRSTDPMPTTTTRASTTTTLESTTAKSRVRTADALFQPENGNREMLILIVGVAKHRRTLVAVAEPRQNIIAGNNDVIQIYENLVEGKLYQTLPCNRPSGLTTINARDETILAFLEGNMGVQIYTYRGIQGFVPFVSFKLTSQATHMTSLALPTPKPYQCPTNYLVVVAESNLLFYEAVSCGDCVDAKLNCDIY